MRTISGFFTTAPNIKLHERPEAFEIYPPESWSWFFLRPRQLVLFMQDNVHLVTKWRNRILSTTAELTIGDFRVTSQDLLDLLSSPDMKLEHNLVTSDVNPRDRQNFLTCKKICSPEVLELLKKSNRTYATYLYLQLLQYIIKAYYETETSMKNRLYLSWTVTFVCRMWKISLKYNAMVKKKIFNEKISQQKRNKFFISHQSYHSIEINCHNLLFLMILVKRRDLPISALNVLLFSSQPCEATFRNARALSGIYHSAVNFTMSNFLHRSEKLGILNDLKYFQSSNDNEQIIQFPVHHKKKANRGISTDSNDIYTMDFEEIILAAFEHAKQLLDKLGVLSVLRKNNAFELNDLSSKVRASIRLNVNATSYFLNNIDSMANQESEQEYDTESDEEEEMSDSNECFDDISMYDEDQYNVDTTGQNELITNRTHFNGMRIFDSVKPTMKNSYFRMRINGNIKYIHKQTCCWMLTETDNRLPADRLSRIIRAAKIE